MTFQYKLFKKSIYAFIQVSYWLRSESFQHGQFIGPVSYLGRIGSFDGPYHFGVVPVCKI